MDHAKGFSFVDERYRHRRPELLDVLGWISEVQLPQNIIGQEWALVRFHPTGNKCVHDVVDAGALLVNVPNNSLRRLMSRRTEQQDCPPLCLAEFQAAIDDSLESLVHTHHGTQGLSQTMDLFEFFDSSFESSGFGIQRQHPRKY
jgi:hypothetical protein